MKLCIRCLLFAVLISLVAVPASAALYNASGRWLLETEPNQSLSLGPASVEVPEMGLWVEIVQEENTGLFALQSDPIPELGGIRYTGVGTFSNSIYTFDPVLTETRNLNELPGYESMPSILLTVSLSGFELITESNLIGAFDVDVAGFGNAGTIAFSGSSAAVPLPAAAWLLGTGLAALFGFRRKVLS